MIQLAGFPIASFAQSITALEPELEAMLQKTLGPSETLYFKIQAAPAEALVLTTTRIIVLKGAQRGQNGQAYGRFFRVDEINRFEYRGWPRTTFIAVITKQTALERIPAFALWKCTFGVTISGSLGSSTATYLQGLEQWLAAERRYTLVNGPLAVIQPLNLAVQPGEIFHLQVAATYYEEKAVRQYVGGSSGVSIPVGRGVRFRVGASRGQSVTQHVLEADDQGMLAIGSRRIVFSGTRRNLSIPLSTIATVDVFSDGLRVGVPNRTTMLFKTSDEIAGIVLKRLLKIP
jgi:hypothetical protein